jgi:hypothetical protein
MGVAGWQDIGVLIAQLVAKEPPYLQIAIGLCAAFTALMILEGLRASFLPRRDERGHSVAARHIAPPTASPFFRSAPANAAKLPRNPKRETNIVKSHRTPRPTIRRQASKPQETALSGSPPQVASFGD